MNQDSDHCLSRVFMSLKGAIHLSITNIYFSWVCICFKDLVLSSLWDVKSNNEIVFLMCPINDNESMHYNIDNASIN